MLIILGNARLNKGLAAGFEPIICTNYCKNVGGENS